MESTLHGHEPGLVAPDSKEIETLKARAALLGFEIKTWLQLTNRERVYWCMSQSEMGDRLTMLETARKAVME